MLKLYIKLAVRALFRKRTQGIINLIGLSAGLGSFLLIALFVYHEFSYDRFHDKHENIWRTAHNVIIGESDPQLVPASTIHTGPLAGENLPEVESFVRLVPMYTSTLVEHDDHAFDVSSGMFVDSTFFRLFSFPLLLGNKDNVLNTPNTVVLTRELAEKLFGDYAAALNQDVRINGEPYRVNGVAENPVANSHIDFEMLVPFIQQWDGTAYPWTGFNCYTYILTRPGTDGAELQPRLDELMRNFYASSELYNSPDARFEPVLQPLTSIHLHSNLVWELKQNGSYNSVLLFVFLGIFILVIAIINYVNITTARSGLRAREIGLKKVMGSSRRTLFWQFITESFLITFFAFLAAIILAEVSSGFFSSLMNRDLKIYQIFNVQGVLFLLVLFIFTALLAGSYPALYLSSLQPHDIFKNKIAGGGKTMRKALVIFQFSITLFILSMLLILLHQRQFINRYDLGFNKEQVMVVRNISEKISTPYASVKTELMQIPDVLKVGASSQDFTASNRIDLVRTNTVDFKDAILTHILLVDAALPEVLELNISLGRGFDPELRSEEGIAMIPNEQLMRKLKLDDAINSDLFIGLRPGKIVGVAANFHFTSLHQDVEPALFVWSNEGYNHIYIKTNTDDYSLLEAKITNVLKKFDENIVPEITFLSRQMDEFYRAERQSSRLAMLGSILAVLISLLGVYALTAFLMEQKSKEIAMRKILGASFSSLLWIFNKENIILILASLFIAAPLAYWSADVWLDNFAYRIELQWWHFLLPMAIALLLGVLTVSIQTSSTAAENPANVLSAE